MPPIFAALLAVATAAVVVDGSSRHSSEHIAASSLLDKLRQKQEALWTRQMFVRLGHQAGPPRATYEGTMNMPVIGRQTFRVRFMGGNRARITLKGKINLDELSNFTPTDASSDGSDGGLTLMMDFNEPTLEVLRSWGTRIRATRFYADDDFVMLVIKPPVIPAIRVRLLRVV
jgi:hypothetical protein